MADANEWKAVGQQVLDSLDVAAEYAALGVVFARDHVSGKGWRACHAVDRKDATASAAVNVGDGPARGRYRDLGGVGLTLNLWEFAARFGKFTDWRAARKHYAEKAGVKMPAGCEPKRPDDGVEFLENAASDLILAGWAEAKGGFGLASVRANGGLYGRYPKKSKPEYSQYVVAFPAFNPPGLTDAEPSAWVIANTTGGGVRVFKGKNKPDGESKTLSVGGSVGGLLGLHALLALAAEKDGGPPVEVVWKVEGLSDVLALHHALGAAGLLGKHVVLSNSQGTLETVKPGWVELLAGKTVYVVHDRDRPGQTGAGRWCDALLPHCPCVKSVELPYPLKDAHGEDTRDFLHRDKRPFSELLAVAEAAPVYAGDGSSRDALSPFTIMPPGAPAHGAGSLFGTTPDAATGATPESATVTPTAFSPSPSLVVYPLAAAGGVPSAPSVSKQARDATAILDLVGIDVLGEYTQDKGKIDVYSRNCKKVVLIESIDHFSYRRLIQMCGESAILYVHDGKDRVEGKHTMEEVRQAISLKCSNTDIGRVGMLGQGVWESEGHVIVVNGGTAAVYDRAKHCLGRITDPRVSTKTIIDFSATEPWVDFMYLNAMIAKAGDRDWAWTVVDDAQKVFKNWNWKHSQDSLTTALLVALTYIQTTLLWRPEVAVTGPSDCGKALSLDTPLPTPSGWVTMGDVKVGDELYDDNGRPCVVEAVTGIQYDRDCYEVAFDNGESVVCCADHLWSVRDCWSSRPNKTMTTRDMAKTLAEKPLSRRTRYSIPAAKPLECGSPKPQRVAPYVLGFWLGDGETACNRISVGKQDVVNTRQNLAVHELLGESRKNKGDDNYHLVVGHGFGGGSLGTDRLPIAKRRDKSIRVTPGKSFLNEHGVPYAEPESLNTRLRQLGVLDNKHIPQAYLRSSVEDRMELLRGLMDTDGSIRTDGQAEYSTKLERLRDNVLELLASLEFKSKWYPKVVKGVTYYRIQFAPTDGRRVFSLTRKASRQRTLKPHTRKSKSHRIVRITPVASVPVKCIRVSSPSHLFLCGSRMIPTHNSTIANTLSLMFGGLNMYVQKPTEAGLRQHMGNTAKAVLIDEFENDSHRQKILEMLRTTSQGGDVIRGTSDQKGKAFRIKHIPWMMAIESGLTKAADRNRFIVLDLQSLSSRVRGKLRLPSEFKLKEMGVNLCAVALRYMDEAMSIFAHLKGVESFDGVHGRVIESFSVPASLYAAIKGDSGDGAVRRLGELLADRMSIGRQGGGDETDLMKTILDSTFQAGSGLPPVSVSEVISDPDTYLSHHTTLESQGVAMTEGRPGIRRPVLEGKKFIFMDLDKVKRYLLRGTPWWNMDCEQLLLRLKGASRQQRKMGSQRIWGIELPLGEWVETRAAEERVASLLPDDPAAAVEPAVPPEASPPPPDTAAAEPTPPKPKLSIFQDALQKIESLNIKGATADTP